MKPDDVTFTVSTLAILVTDKVLLENVISASSVNTPCVPAYTTLPEVNAKFLTLFNVALAPEISPCINTSPEAVIFPPVVLKYPVDISEVELALIFPEAVILPPNVWEVPLALILPSAVIFPEAVVLPIIVNFPVNWWPWLAAVPNTVFAIETNPFVIVAVEIFACVVLIVLVLLSLINEEFQYLVGEPKSTCPVFPGKIEPDVSIPNNISVEPEV